jgi:putative aldouronate transport system substrate-binding protein
MNKQWLQPTVFTCLALGVVLAGCSSATDTTGTAVKETAKPEKRGSITASLYDRGKVPPAEGTMDNNRWTKWINEKGPVDVKFVPIPRAEAIQKLNTLFASGDVPDVIMEFSTSFINQMVSQKQLLPLDDLIEKHSTEYKKILQEYPQLKKIATNADGKMYAFGRANGSRPNVVLLIRMDWLKKLNLQIPQTTEELFQVAKAFAEQDPDGNGQKDTYGFSMASAEANNAVNNMFGDAGWIIENGVMMKPWDRWKSALEYKKRLFEAGVVDKDYLTDKNGEKAKKDWISGKLGIYFASQGIHQVTGYQLHESLKKNVPTAEAMPIALPKSQYGQFSTTPGNPLQLTTMIYQGAKDPVAAMKYVDFMVTKQNWVNIFYGDEGTHYKTGANGCPEILDREKYRIEVSYTEDLSNYGSRLQHGDCYEPEATMDPSKPFDKEFLGMIKEARKNYQDPGKPYPGVTTPEHMPELPKDLIVLNTDITKQLEDISVKSIVSGASYPADKALQDAKAVWDKIGGKQFDDFYAKWYAENKDKAFLLKDVYGLMKKPN